MSHTPSLDLQLKVVPGGDEGAALLAAAQSLAESWIKQGRTHRAIPVPKVWRATSHVPKAILVV